MENNANEGAPKNAAFTLTVPLDREKSKTATFYLKDMTEDVFMAARTMLDKGKNFDATRMMIKALQVGGDDVKLLEGNFVACRSADQLLVQLIAPVEGELKKN